MLQHNAPHLVVTSAGIGAVVGNGADQTAFDVAATHGVSLGGHVSRQFTAEMGRAADLILVMEPGHKAQIARDTPQLSGKTMLFDHWTGAEGIADPYKRSAEFHELVFRKIESAAAGWIKKLPNAGDA